MADGLRIGIDVGGTFTDLFLVDEATGETFRHKLSSTPDDPSWAPIRGIAELLDTAGRLPRDVRFVGLGTTVATNALLERKVSETGLVTTAGFRDLLEIGRQTRPHVYDLFAQRPEPLVSRERRLEVRERIDADGTVLLPLADEDVERAVERLRALGCRSVAICFLNSYVNPAHERRAAEIVRASWPEAAVAISHELLPEFREYERLSSTVTNASLMPVMRRYLARFSDEVRTLGIPEAPFVMSSGGGVFTPDLAAERPIDTLFSGPSGGVSGALHVGHLAGERGLVTFDMGGTSTDVCLVRDGRPEVTPTRSVGGLPIKSMAVDIHTVGAGGSSVAWVDAGGLLRVGPLSAGADPGPACYGIGGDRPTVTDANVALGRLNQEHLLAGALRIDAARAAEAIDRVVARPKGMSVNEAAAAILAVSNTNIAQAIRFVSVQRGLDPADFVLVAFGGAGPLHAAEVARELGMTVLIPPSPGVLCAMGVLTKDVQLDLSQTRILRLTEPDAAATLDELYMALNRRARATFADNGIDTAALVVERSVDARYVGQNFELSVPLPSEAVGGDLLAAARSGFDRAHARVYGYDQPDKDVELVTFRAKAVLKTPVPVLRSPEARRRKGPLTPMSGRDTWFESPGLEQGRFIPCPVYEREQLLPGDVLYGPAIVEQMDTTTLLPPDFVARVDEHENLRLEAVGRSA